MLNGPAVVSAAHALLSGYVSYALWHGAKSRVRRDLGCACLSLAMHTLFAALAYASLPPIRGVLRALSLDAAVVGGIFLLRFAASLGEPHAPPAHRRTRPLAWFSVGCALVAFVVSVSDIWTELHGGFRPENTIVLILVIFGQLAASIGTIAFGARGSVDARRRAARAYLFVTLWPGLMVVWAIARMLGAPMGPYRLVRDISLLMTVYAMLSAYLNHAEEPMSLRVRFVAGTLTITLAVVCAVCEIELPSNPEEVIDAVTLSRASRDAWRLLAIAVGSYFVVLVVIPRLYRRSLVDPIDRLVAGMARLQNGERDVLLSIDYNDELGYVTASFNRLTRSLANAEQGLATRIEELRTKNSEVRTLNQELRLQVAARTRELAQVLVRTLPDAHGLGVGDEVDGRYRVEELIGRGGMGTVYAVRRLHDGHRLALKVMRGTTRERIDRFAREARIAASLDHPNLVSIVDVGVADGIIYAVMELIEGGSLEDHRDRFGDVGWSLDVLVQLANALVALHERGIVHRDLKPANVLLACHAQRNVVKVTDFGVALEEADPLGSTAAPRSAALERLTRAGAMIGTLAYMAPEIAQGAQHASPAADVFAFGLIAYEMLNGESAFDAPPVLLARVLPPAPAFTPVIGAVVAAALTKCLAKDPNLRPTACELADALSSPS